MIEHLKSVIERNRNYRFDLRMEYAEQATKNENFTDKARLSNMITHLDDVAVQLKYCLRTLEGKE